MEEISILISVIAFGLVVGSFLNVVIYRLPLEKSIVKPRSFCPKCKKQVKFYDNIPVISYIILLGKCRYCRTPISALYPLVELLTGFSFWLSYMHYGLTVHAGFTALFLCLLIALAFIDYQHQILPNEMTIGGSVVFLIYAFFNPYVVPLEAFIAAFGSALFFTLLYVFYLKVRKIEGLGQGDIKLVIMLGAFLGLKKFIIALLVASILGLIVGIFFIIFKGKDLKMKLPFGTFLNLGSFIALFWGLQILTIIQGLYKIGP